MYYIYRQIKCDIKLYKYNIDIRLSSYKLDLYIGIDLGNWGYMA